MEAANGFLRDLGTAHREAGFVVNKPGDVDMVAVAEVGGIGHQILIRSEGLITFGAGFGRFATGVDFYFASLRQNNFFPQVSHNLVHE